MATTTHARIFDHTTATQSLVVANQTSDQVSSSNTNTNTNTNVNTASTGTTQCSGPTTVQCSGGNQLPTCTSYPCLIFHDDFETLNHEVWEHEITAGGGGNWEFQYYTNNRSNSYVRDGVLYIKPTLTSEHFGEEFLTHGSLELWGSQPGDVCTGNAFYGCRRDGNPTNIINPIQSARLRSTRGFRFKYGKVEVEAKLPTGDWLWPAIWMLPYRNAYGQWPASGEIDIVESRGNLDYVDDQGQPQGVNHMGSTLHFGPNYWHNRYETAHGEKTAASGTFGDSFHKYGVEWDENHIRFTVDDDEVLNVAPAENFWKHGGLDTSGLENPWEGATKMAPFDQEFFLIMNVAVGGINYFPDTFTNRNYPKPWSNKSPAALRDFWNQHAQWYPTWNPDKNKGEDAAMQVNYIKVWKMKP
ncbi:hypothetical protein CHS0354_024321 [Potamilus streckersoni]|uniref:GH16 domain-containing protein n=1 Tax=Potamilus streckersoni TaxID=2493646 RepID=A0AAE0VH59_9BIVA|nr:hypothetical protein CHS0354_024321 [Potamilus streckersoni]